MTKANIVIELQNREQANNYIDDVRQLFMRRNPLDEPFISIVDAPDAALNVAGGSPMKFSEWFKENHFDECADMIDGGMDTISFLYVDYVNEFHARE